MAVSRRETMRKTLAVVAGLLLVAGMAGCRVHTQKDANGHDKNVAIDTPFGGVHVNSDQTTAGDLGLPVYPGAEPSKDTDHHESADVRLGFGEWQLRVKVASYESPDPQDKILAFYKQAMSRYGSVITCDGNQPVGQPAATNEGLTCQDDSKGVNINMGKKDEATKHFDGLQLRAGSKHHQHIVGFEKTNASRSRFSLIALDLPRESGNSKDGKE